MFTLTIQPSSHPKPTFLQSQVLEKQQKFANEINIQYVQIEAVRLYKQCSINQAASHSHQQMQQTSSDFSNQYFKGKKLNPNKKT